MKLGKPQDALACFDAALELSARQDKNANQDRILTGKAVALQQTGRMDEAADLYKKLLARRSSNSPELLSNLIAVSIARKDDARVKELSERLLKVRPQSRQALEGLAAVALSRGDYSAGVQYCSQLSMAAPECYEGWFNLGIAYQKTGRWEQAANAYKHAVRIQPDATEASANLGVVLQERAAIWRARGKPMSACSRPRRMCMAPAGI